MVWELVLCVVFCVIFGPGGVVSLCVLVFGEPFVVRIEMSKLMFMFTAICEWDFSVSVGDNKYLVIYLVVWLRRVAFFYGAFLDRMDNRFRARVFA